MPQLGESVTEGMINTWFVKEGQTVKKYDPIAEILTDKVTAEIPSLFTGTIKEIIASEGEAIPVGELICYIEIEGEELEKNKRELKPKKETEPVKGTSIEQSNNQRFSPAVLKLSQEHNIDLNKVAGTGKGGRITRKDIRKIIEEGMPTVPTVERTVVKENHQQKDQPIVQAATGDLEIPLTGIRKTIAANTERSVQEIPHGWMMIEVDVTDLVQYRNLIKDEFRQKEGFNLTYFSFFVKAVVEGLKQYPELNSQWGTDKIIQKKDLNISIAVASGNVLFTPVIKNADEKSIKGIAKDVYDLANKARSGQLEPEDVEGGTFTVNNTGVFGSVQSMGIINHPQTAILQVESIVKRPVVMDNGMMGPRDIVNLCLSLDHRVLDGLVCGHFLALVKDKLENMNADNTSIY